MKNIFLFIFLVSSIGLLGQGQRPETFPLEPNPNNDNFQIFSQKNGLNRRATLSSLLKYFGVEIITTPDPPSPTGNTGNLNKIWDDSGDLYFVDQYGKSRKIDDVLDEVTTIYSGLTDPAISSTKTGDIWVDDVINPTFFRFRRPFGWIEIPLNSSPDQSIANEGSLTVNPGTVSTSIIESNTALSTGITFDWGQALSVSESGNTITITNINEVDGSITNELDETTSSSTAPVSPKKGDVWVDTANSQVSKWDGSNWVILVSGAIAGDNLGNHIATKSLDMGGFQVNEVANPINPADAANKFYVDESITESIAVGNTQIGFGDGSGVIGSSNLTWDGSLNILSPTGGVNINNISLLRPGISPATQTLVLTSTGNQNPTRLYFSPKVGSNITSGPVSVLKMFGTDYLTDTDNYIDYGMWVEGDNIVFNSKVNGSYIGSNPSFSWRRQDNTELMFLDCRNSPGRIRLNQYTPGAFPSNSTDTTLLVLDADGNVLQKNPTQFFQGFRSDYWTESGGNLYRNSNITIGNSSMLGDRLSINNSSGTNSGIGFFKASIRNWTILDDANNDWKLARYVAGIFQANEIIIDNSTGNIGFGTTSVNDAKFSFLGNVKFQTYPSSEFLKTDALGIVSPGTFSSSASSILTAINTVDGSGSGLDADLLDGLNSDHYLDFNNLTNTNNIIRTDTPVNGNLIMGSYLINNDNDGNGLSFLPSGGVNIQSSAQSDGLTVTSTTTGVNGPTVKLNMNSPTPAIGDKQSFAFNFNTSDLANNYTYAQMQVKLLETPTATFNNNNPAGLTFSTRGQASSMGERFRIDSYKVEAIEHFFAIDSFSAQGRVMLTGLPSGTIVNNVGLSAANELVTGIFPNLYNTSGTLTASRTITRNNFGLTLLGGNTGGFFTHTNTQSQTGFANGTVTSSVRHNATDLWISHTGIAGQSSIRITETDIQLEDLAVIEAGFVLEGKIIEPSTATDFILYNPTFWGQYTRVYLDNISGNATIRSFGSLRDGQVFTITNNTNFSITLKHNDTTSGTNASGRLFLPNSTDLVISKYESVTLEKVDHIGGFIVK